MRVDLAAMLRDSGIQPSAQRVAVARYILATDEHPTADEVWRRVKVGFPQISRATVYNTLHTLVKRGLLRQHTLAEGRVVFDPNVGPHHHFIDESSGRVFDVPWDTIKVYEVGAAVPRGFDLDSYQVVLRGRRRKR
jgi:Fe2+ or Zn2+ uptake regulation protein